MPPGKQKAESIRRKAAGTRRKAAFLLSATPSRERGGDEVTWTNSIGRKGPALVFSCARRRRFASPAQTFTTLHSFDNTDGADPTAALVQGTDGNFYGTTVNGRAHVACPDGGCGTVFKIASLPGGLTGDQAGDLYGTTYLGGNSACGGSGCGTVFKLDALGRKTTLYTFTGSDGASPVGGLIRDTAGNLYGTTAAGGNFACPTRCGTVFRLDLGGNETVLYRFTGRSDGFEPEAGLLADGAGNLYGTTVFGGHGSGVVFEITPAE